jgi:competence protein ComEC
MRAQVAPAMLAPLLALAWLGGTAWQLRQADVLGAADGAALAVAAAVGALASWRWRHGWPGLGVLMLASAALAFAATSGRAAWRLAEALPAALEGQDLVVTGEVSDLPRVSLIGTRFVFEVESATRQGEPVTVPRRLSLGWYRGADEGALLAGPAADLRAGQRWRLPVRLRRPHGLFNPHGFDLELWLFEQGIRAGGTVRSTPGATAQLLADDAGHAVDRLRQDLRDAVYRHLPDAATAGVLAALAVGDQAAIERDDWDLFRITGVAHLMSISGLHVTMFAWLVGGIVSRLWRLSPRAMLTWPTPQAARWLGLAGATAYALLAGWGVPAQRTVWMIAVVALLRSLGLRWPLPRVLLAAALAVALADPWALLQPGFWLSFVAVGLLVGSEPVQAARPAAAPATATWRSRLWTAVRGGLRTQVVATVGLAPLTMVFFQQVSLVGFVANLLAIPLVTLLITPLALLGLLLPTLWLPAGALVQGLTVVLEALASWPWSVWTAAAAPPWAVAAGLVGGLVAVLPLPWRLRGLALPLMLPLLWPPVERPRDGQFELIAADVGQGTAVLVRTRRHLLVYDTGPMYTPEADAAGRVLLPLLRGRGERRIDLLMLSHRDSDHVGGAASLLRALPVSALSSSLAADHPLRGGGVPHRRCDAGGSWVWDGVRFEVLHPLPGDHDTSPQGNALSCVLRVQGRGGSALLTGDIEAAQEAALVQRAADRLRAEVLIVPHHGSRTSSTPAFIDAVQPRVAVVQAAYRSRFGHPAPAVEARYHERGVALMRSDRCGAWTLPAAGAPRCERLTARRYWHHAGAAAATAAP